MKVLDVTRENKKDQGVTLLLEGEIGDGEDYSWIKNTTHPLTQIFKVAEAKNLNGFATLKVVFAESDDFSVGDIVKPFNRFKAVSDDTARKAGSL